MSFVRHLKGRYPVSTMTVAPQKIANLIKFNRNSKSLATWFSFLLSQGPLRNPSIWQSALAHLLPGHLGSI